MAVEGWKLEINLLMKRSTVVPMGTTVFSFSTCSAFFPVNAGDIVFGLAFFFRDDFAGLILNSVIWERRRAPYRCRSPPPGICSQLGWDSGIRRREYMSDKDFYLYIDGERVRVSSEVYYEYYRGERKEKYFMEDLKRGRVSVDPDTGKEVFIPSREDSYERLLDADRSFAVSGETLDEQVVRSVLLEQALGKLPEEEQALVRELYYLEKTEREVSAALHIAKTTLRRRRDRVLEKLRKLLEENF